MENNKKYISYLDLLGIKEIASYNQVEYYKSMEKFRDSIIKSAKCFIDKSNMTMSNVYFFSDCCFIESTKLEFILDFLRSLRKDLIKDDGALFFSASVTWGTLSASEIGSLGNDSKSKNIKDMIYQYNVEKYLNGIIFQSQDISNVYVLQSEFKGAGIFIDEKSIKDSFDNESDFQKISKDYFSESFFFPSINTSTVKAYKDLQIQKEENRVLYFTRIIERYYNANAKNKKFGRFYLSLLANWISSTDYSRIEYDNIEKKFKNLPVVVENLINPNSVISEIKRSAHCFEFIYFFLLRFIYKSRNDRSDTVTYHYIKEIIKKNVKCKRLLNNLNELPNSVFPIKYKELLINEYHSLLISKDE